MLIENKIIEFKREYVDDIKNTIIAFANSDGGTIFIGMNDDGSVYGVRDVDDTMLRVTNAVRDAIRPDITMFLECRNEIMDDRNVVCVYVQRGTARPYYIQGKGIRPEGVYVRQGASTVPASETAILNMIKETSGDSYEEARSINQNLTFKTASAFFNQKSIAFEKSQMRSLHLIGDDDTYTNLAYLLSDQCEHSIKLAVFEGSEKTVFKDRKELSGSLLKQLESAFEYIDRFNRTRAEFSGLERVDMRDYPIEAIRETLLNAIVHKDYSFSGSTLISIFEDRIEFVTIGGLIKGISLEDVNLGISILRNQYLANIFYRLKLIEAYGTGILKIRESYNKFSVKPLIETTENAFKVTLPNTNYHKESNSKIGYKQNNGKNFLSKKDERVNKILEICHKNGFVVRKDIEMELSISQAAAILLLRELCEDGVLLKIGKAKNLRYYENK